MNIGEIYDAAAAAGMTVTMIAGQTRMEVDWRAPDESLYDGMALGRAYEATWPADRLTLSVGDDVIVRGESYTVRDVRLVGDGSEARALLTRTS